MAEQWIAQLNRLLARKPSTAVWRKICALLEGRSTAELAPFGTAIGGWPASLRSMPADWWAQWSTGDERPWHRFAAHRMLIGKARRARGPETHGEVVVVACDPGYEYAAAGGANDGHSGGGEVGIWDTARRAWRAAVEPEFPLAIDVLFAPRVDLMVTAVWDTPVTVQAWRVPGGDRVWSTVIAEPPAEPAAAEPAAAEPIDAEPIDAEPAAAHDHSVNRVPGNGLPRLGPDRRGGRIAVVAPEYGGAAVLDLHSGTMIHFERSRATAVALNDAGDRLAIGSLDGVIRIRSMPDGELVAEYASGLDRVDTLAFVPGGGPAPAGADLLAAGSVGPAGPAAQAQPALQWLGPDLRATIDLADTLPEPQGAECDEIAWSPTGPRVRLSAPSGPIVVDGVTGRVLWYLPASAAGSCQALTPDGRAVLVGGDDYQIRVEAWPVEAAVAVAEPKRVLAEADDRPTDVAAQFAAVDVELHLDQVTKAIERLLALAQRTAGADRERTRARLEAIIDQFDDEFEDNSTFANVRRRLYAIAGSAERG